MLWKSLLDMANIHLSGFKLVSSKCLFTLTGSREKVIRDDCIHLDLVFCELTRFFATRSRHKYTYDS